MDEADLTAILGSVILVLVVLVGFATTILNRHRGSINTKKQAKRLAIFLVLCAMVPISAHLLIALHVEHTSVSITRVYSDVTTDQAALESAEAFNYYAIAGPLPGNRTMFPPYPYVDHFVYYSSWLAWLEYPNRNGYWLQNYQPASVSYVANITHPNTTLNMTAIFLANIPGETTAYPAYQLENGTWHKRALNDSVVMPVSWLVQVNYLENGAWENLQGYMIVGLNATGNVVAIFRAYALLYMLLGIPPWIIDFLAWAAWIVFAIFFIAQTAIVLLPFKKKPREHKKGQDTTDAICTLILNAIREQPGLPFADLANKIRALTADMLVHLGHLQRSGAIEEREINHHTVFFDMREKI